MIEEGQPAPDFELSSDKGEKVHPVVGSAASPSFSTSIPRTTRRAALCRRVQSATRWGEFEGPAGRSCSGSVPTTVESRGKLHDKYPLPFTLLADRLTGLPRRTGS